MEHEERSQRLVRRIEAFSDLVMGFSVGLLGLTLVVPTHAAVLLLHPLWLVSYFVTFGLIAFLWMRHQRLFSMYFIPLPACVVANFVFLSMLGLFVYFVQVFAHVRGEFDQAIAVIGYAGSYAVAMLALGFMYAVGTRERWKQLAPQDRFIGFSNASRALIVGTVLLLACIVSPLVFFEFKLIATYTVATAVIVGALVSRVWVNYQRPRIIGAAHAGA
ncbi:MAG: DUF1211 domain-containing protein [Candidatus Eremiobacteraeota bacterium]|nr:DUF1211 domain-containing protein [Candidatus Eremiobacteraeota bacterium]